MSGFRADAAQLFFYHSGTSTAAPVYVGSSLTFEHPRPVLAASLARLPAIYLDEALTYRLVVRDASGRLVEDVDPVVPTGTGARGNGPLVVTPQQFGAVADDTGAFGPHKTDNYAAFKAALDYLETLALDAFSGDPDHQVLPTLHIPLALYYCSQTLELKAGLFNIVAEPGARIRFPANMHGIIIHAFDTISDRIHDPAIDGPYKRASGTRIRDLLVRGGGGTQKKHGFWLRTGAILERCGADHFPGDGFHVVGGVASGGAGRGNANLFKLIDCAAHQNLGNGFFADGPDANAGYGIGLDAQFNGRWGVYDSSFLGNTWIGCHTDSNGLVGVGPNPGPRNAIASLVYHNHVASGRQGWWFVKLNQDAAASTTEPGTNDNVWVFNSFFDHSRTDVPQWASGGTYSSGGSYAADDPSGTALFMGCYVEGTQAAPQVLTPGMVVGGTMDNKLGAHVYGHQGKLASKNFVIRNGISGGEAATVFGDDVQNGLILEHFQQGNNGSPWRFRVTPNAFQMEQQNAPAPVYRITHYGSTETFGRAGPLKHAFAPFKLVIGDRWHGSISAVVDLAGVELARGDIFYYREPSPGGKLGVVCTKAGRGGTTAVLKEFGSIDP